MGPDAFGRPPMTSLVNVSLGVAAPSHHSLYAIPPASAARLAHNGERRPAHVGQDHRAVAGHASANFDSASSSTPRTASNICSCRLFAMRFRHVLDDEQSFSKRPSSRGSFPTRLSWL